MMAETAASKVNTEEITNAGVEKDPGKPKVHTMHYDSHGSQGPGVYCTCGQKKVHRRGKVLAAWAQKHTTKTHHLWMGVGG
jgi:hypothetical protein